MRCPDRPGRSIVESSPPPQPAQHGEAHQKLAEAMESRPRPRQTTLVFHASRSWCSSTGSNLHCIASACPSRAAAHSHWTHRWRSACPARSWVTYMSLRKPQPQQGEEVWAHQCPGRMPWPAIFGMQGMGHWNAQVRQGLRRLHGSIALLSLEWPRVPHHSSLSRECSVDRSSPLVVIER